MRRYSSNKELYHSGKRGMRWGYNYGQPNGNRTATVRSTSEQGGSFTSVQQDGVGSSYRAQKIQEKAELQAQAKAGAEAKQARFNQFARNTVSWLKSAGSDLINKGREYYEKAKRGY